MNSNYQKWIIAGLTTIGAGALLYYLLDSGSKNSKEEATLSQQDLKKILKDLDNELLAVYVNLSGLVKSLKAQLGDIDDINIKEFVESRFHISKKIQSIANKIYEKHSTTEEAVKRACEILENTDKDIRDLSDLIRNNLQNAYQGVDPKLSIDVPDFLTAELTKEILEEMYATARLVSYERIEEVEKRGIKRDIQSKEFLDEVKNMETWIEEAECEVFQKYGLYALKQAPKKVLHDAIYKYSHTDPLFNREVLAIEEEHKSDMADILQGRFSINRVELLRDLLRKNKRIIAESKEEAKTENLQSENTENPELEKADSE